MSALGLTCREAFVVFSQNETLYLQKEVERLQQELANLKQRHARESYEKYVKLSNYRGALLSYGYCTQCEGTDHICYCNQGCHCGNCSVCGRFEPDCHCDWTCFCSECDEDRDILKRRGLTDDEIRTYNRTHQTDVTP